MSNENILNSKFGGVLINKKSEVKKRYKEFFN